MILKLLAAIVIGFVSSRLLYKPLHRDEVPEMFRYGVGVMVVILVTAIFIGDAEKREEAIEGILMASIGVGAGVGASRLFG